MLLGIPSIVAAIIVACVLSTTLLLFAVNHRLFNKIFISYN
uniref:Uncharacterized protein n=1 Tax=Arundo donax TaxID=35708 RepID=A0A0A9AP99_ARUDO